MKAKLVLYAQALTENGLEEFWIPIIDLTAFIQAKPDSEIPVQREDESVFWIVKENLINIQIWSYSYEV